MTTKTSYIQAGPYQDIISGIQLIFSFSDGVARVTGPEGTGKSSLLDALVDTLQDEGQLALLFKVPPKTAQELQNHLIRELALPASLGFRKALARFITARPRDRQQLVLLFDDAEQMDADTLLALLQLREVAHNNQSLISIVLAGLPALNALLARPELAEPAKDIALSYELDALNLKELEQFCNAAIDSLDLQIPRPSARTLEYLLEQTGGLPGPVLALLPDMVAEPESAPAAATNARLAPAVAAKSVKAVRPQAATPQVPALSLAARLGRLRQPFDTHKLRQALYGGTAVAATAAAAYLLYPQLTPLWRNPSPAPQPVATAPAAPAPIPEPPAPAAEPSPPAAALAEATPAAATEPQAEPAVATLVPPDPVTVTPPPPRSPLSVVPTFPDMALQDLTPDTLEAVVRDWISAWQNQDLDAYFSAYHTDFAPLYQGTRAAWRENRSRSIRQPAAISIALEDFTVNGESVVGTHVSFWLEYHTATYADRTLKELVIGHDLDGSLRILQEINRQVTALSPSALQNRTTTLTTVNPPAAAAPRQQRSSAAATTRTRIGPPVQLGASPTEAADAMDTGAAVDPALGRELHEFLTGWLQAWQRQDVAGYLGHYHPDFRSSAFATRAAWEDDRTRKITRPLAIQIHLQHLQVLAAGSNQGEVELQMEYRSSFYADRTRKSLRLGRGSSGNWLITDERNLQVEALPLARLVPGTTLTLRNRTNTIFEHAL